MSQENVEIVRRMYDAFHAGDVERALESLRPKRAGRCVQCPRPTSASARAREYVNAVVTSWVAAWEEWHEEIEEMRDLGSRVLVLSVQRGRGKGSGVEVEAHYAMLYDLHGDAIISMRMYGRVAEALEAAGLRGVGDVAGERGDRTSDVAMRAARGLQTVAFVLTPTSWAVDQRSERRRSSGPGGNLDIRRWADQSGTLGPSRSSEIIDASASRWSYHDAQRPVRGARVGHRHRLRHGAVHLRDGKVVRGRAFSDPTQALEAAGLSE